MIRGLNRHQYFSTTSPEFGFQQSASGPDQPLWTNRCHVLGVRTWYWYFIPHSETSQVLSYKNKKRSVAHKTLPKFRYHYFNRLTFLGWSLELGPFFSIKFLLELTFLFVGLSFVGIFLVFYDELNMSQIFSYKIVWAFDKSLKLTSLILLTPGTDTPTRFSFSDIDIF